MKNCPTCSSQQLMETTYKRQHVDVCPLCQGLWFEAGEFNQALICDRTNPAPANTDVEGNTSAPIGISQLHCPECDALMENRLLLQNYAVEVETCPHGHGMWVERHELKDALASGHLLEPFKRLNKGIGWKSWLFQFFTHLPVEYNLKPKHFPLITLLLVLTNTLLFIGGIIDPEFHQHLRASGAMIPVQITHGIHLPTLITNLFLHGSWMHLLGNMYFLWVIGDNLEDVLGKTRFLLIYLFCGVLAALSQAFSTPDGLIPVIGASGAIAGLFGMYLVWFRRASLTFMILVFQKKLPPWGFFLIWIGINLYSLFKGGHGVAYMAHIGGFTTGLALGFMLKSWIEERNPILQLLMSKAVSIKR